MIEKCQIIETAFRSICLFKSGLKILMAIASNLFRSSENGKLVAIGLNLLRWKFILWLGVGLSPANFFNSDLYISQVRICLLIAVPFFVCWCSCTLVRSLLAVSPKYDMEQGHKKLYTKLFFLESTTWAFNFGDKIWLNFTVFQIILSRNSGFVVYNL